MAVTETSVKMCNGTAVAQYTNVDVTKNGKTFTCFNASSLIQTVQEDARHASYAYNCGERNTLSVWKVHARFELCKLFLVEHRIAAW